MSPGPHHQSGFTDLDQLLRAAELPAPAARPGLLEDVMRRYERGGTRTLLPAWSRPLVPTAIAASLLVAVALSLRPGETAGSSNPASPELLALVRSDLARIQLADLRARTAALARALEAEPVPVPVPSPAQPPEVPTRGATQGLLAECRAADLNEEDGFGLVRLALLEQTDPALGVEYLVERYAELERHYPRTVVARLAQSARHQLSGRPTEETTQETTGEKKS